LHLFLGDNLITNMLRGRGSGLELMAQLYPATAGTPGNADSVNWLLK
jgi:hypothetical protein